MAVEVRAGGLLAGRRRIHAVPFHSQVSAVFEPLKSTRRSRTES
jgi:hypothetical protein